MDSFTFEDFIPTYPEDTDPNLQHLITIKNEFLEVSGTTKESLPKRGEYYRHQKALFRYMLYHDRMLNIQETGTGKSCSLVAIAEYFKKFPKEIKHVYILEKGPATIDEFKKQIACVCTPEKNDYITEKVMDITSREKDRKSNLTRALHKWYSFLTYGTFASMILNEKLNDEQLAEKYSGCIFFVDEAHNLSEDRSIKNRKFEVKEENSEDTEKEIEKKQQYDVLWKIFHLVKRSKIILGTATPMINEVNEIAPLMNLLLPIDQQMPIGWDYENITLEQIEPFFRGKVSYVRGLDTGAHIVYKGDRMKTKYNIKVPKENQKVPFMAMRKDIHGNILEKPVQPKLELEAISIESQSILKRVEMSKHQLEGYTFAAQEDIKKGDKKESHEFYLHERHAASLVFPYKKYIGDFVSGTPEEATKYIQAEKVYDVKKKEFVKKPDSYKLTPKFKESISDLKQLEELSSKYAFVIKNELNLDNPHAKLDEKGNPIPKIGNVFCFTELVTGSGAIIFSKILEEYGFTKYKQPTSVFQTKEVKKISICSGSSGEKEIKDVFKPALRYGILTNEMSGQERDSLLELFNSYQNRNGDYCKILIGTPTARDGINVFNVRRGYLLSPNWHASGMHQALSRFIRSTSHQMLIDDEKIRLRAEGKDENLASVTVEIYKMASVKSPQDEESVDVRFYQIIEQKDIHIRRMMRYLKQCSFDCPIHYGRNIRENDVDGSPICDYMKCKYKCYPSGDTNNIPDDKIDFTSYDILYSSEVIETCKKEIINLMKTRTSVSIGFLYDFLENYYTKRFINAAVDSIVADRMTIIDRFGYPCFLNTNGILLYTQGDLPFSSQSLDLSDLSYYKDMLFGYIPSKFDDLINESSKYEQEEIIDKIRRLEDPIDKDFMEFEKLVDSLTESKKVAFIEKYFPYILTERKEGGNMILYNIGVAVLRKFGNYLFPTYEPKEDIEATKKFLQEAELKPGRTREETDKPVVNIPFKGEPQEDFRYPDGSYPVSVLVNTYTGTQTSTLSYNVFSNFMKSNYEIRIWNYNEETWRKLEKYEFSPYSNLVKQHTKNIIDQYKDFKEFGLLLADKKFRIIKSSSLSDVNKDTRTKGKGMECKSYIKFDLIELLLHNDYQDPTVNSIKIPAKLNTKKTMMEHFLNDKKVEKSEDELNNFNLEELKYFYKWFEVKEFNKDKICEIIKNIFEEKGMILEL
jgi:hypothetical protein